MSADLLLQLMIPASMTEVIIAIINTRSPTHDELRTCRIGVSVSEERSGQLQLIVYSSNINQIFCTVFGACKFANMSLTSGVLHADGTHAHAHAASHTKYTYDSDCIQNNLLNGLHMAW